MPGRLCSWSWSGPAGRPGCAKHTHEHQRWRGPPEAPDELGDRFGPGDVPVEMGRAASDQPAPPTRGPRRPGQAAQPGRSAGRALRRALGRIRDLRKVDSLPSGAGCGVYPLARRIEQRFPKPCAQVRVLVGGPVMSLFPFRLANPYSCEVAPPKVRTAARNGRSAYWTARSVEVRPLP